jgi:hypothetical protein
MRGFLLQVVPLCDRNSLHRCPRPCSEWDLPVRPVRPLLPGVPVVAGVVTQFWA